MRTRASSRLQRCSGGRLVGVGEDERLTAETVDRKTRTGASSVVIVGRLWRTRARIVTLPSTRTTVFAPAAAPRSGISPLPRQTRPNPPRPHPMPRNDSFRCFLPTSSPTPRFSEGRDPDESPGPADRLLRSSSGDHREVRRVRRQVHRRRRHGRVGSRSHPRRRLRTVGPCCPRTRLDGGCPWRGTGPRRPATASRRQLRIDLGGPGRQREGPHRRRLRERRRSPAVGGRTRHGLRRSLDPRRDRPIDRVRITWRTGGQRQNRTGRSLAGRASGRPGRPGDQRP